MLKFQKDQQVDQYLLFLLFLQFLFEVFLVVPIIKKVFNLEIKIFSFNSRNQIRKITFALICWAAFSKIPGSWNLSAFFSRLLDAVGIFGSKNGFYKFIEFILFSNLMLLFYVYLHRICFHNWFFYFQMSFIQTLINLFKFILMSIKIIELLKKKNTFNVLIFSLFGNPIRFPLY